MIMRRNNSDGKMLVKTVITTVALPIPPTDSTAAGRRKERLNVDTM